MSSVVVGWTGQCPDPLARKRLTGHLRRLAEVSHDFLRTKLPRRTTHGLERVRRADVECVSQAIVGQILVSSRTAPDRESFVKAAHAAGLPAFDHAESDSASLALLDNARLSGIDFRLFDPRELYPGRDRMSFVFLETPGTPFLDGRLVQVHRSEACKLYAAELIRGANFYLTAPAIELHAYLEDWSDLLLAWVKYFFVEDLCWRRREEMQGFEDYRDIFLDVETTLGRERAERSTFDAILATFAQQAEHGSAEMAAGAEV
jgi:hypothetical protein